MLLVLRVVVRGSRLLMCKRGRELNRLTVPCSAGRCLAVRTNAFGVGDLALGLLPNISHYSMSVWVAPGLGNIRGRASDWTFRREPFRGSAARLNKSERLLL